MTLIGQDGPAVVISARTAAWLARNAGLSSLRVRVRGADPELSRELEEIHVAGMRWAGSVSAEPSATRPRNQREAGDRWIGTRVAADLAQVSTRAVTKAIAEKRLPAERVGGHWRINRLDLEHWKAARRGRAA